MYSSGILRNTSSSPCPNAPQNKARPARTARREKPHTMGSMTPPPPPLFPAPQALLPSTTILRKMPADTLLPATTSTGRSAQADRFPYRGNQGRYSSIVPGHWTYLYGVLAGSVKYNAGLRSRTFGSRNPALRISKALCLRRIVAAFIAITVAISVTTTPRSRLPRLPSPRPSPWRDSTFAAATTPSAGTGPALFAPSRPRLRPRPRCVRFRHGPTHCVPGGRHDRKKRRGYIQGLHLRLPARTISESPAR